MELPTQLLRATLTIFGD